MVPVSKTFSGFNTNNMYNDLVRSYEKLTLHNKGIGCYCLTVFTYNPWTARVLDANHKWQ